MDAWFFIVGDCIRVTETKHETKCLKSQIKPQFTTAPIEASKAVPTTQAVWISLPAPGKKCPYTSMCRSMLNSLILGPNPPVHSVSLRKQYAVRGKRLIHLGSLLAYIESVAAAQQPGKSSAADADEDGTENHNNK